jgi:hypothetical protein
LTPLAYAGRKLRDSSPRSSRGPHRALFAASPPVTVVAVCRPALRCSIWWRQVSYGRPVIKGTTGLSATPSPTPHSVQPPECGARSSGRAPHFGASHRCAAAGQHGDGTPKQFLRCQTAMSRKAHQGVCQVSVVAVIDRYLSSSEFARLIPAFIFFVPRGAY